jgi:hypothetical protein
MSSNDIPIYCVPLEIRRWFQPGRFYKTKDHTGFIGLIDLLSKDYELKNIIDLCHPLVLLLR